MTLCVGTALRATLVKLIAQREGRMSWFVQGWSGLSYQIWAAEKRMTARSPTESDKLKSNQNPGFESEDSSRIVEEISE